MATKIQCKTFQHGTDINNCEIELNSFFESYSNVRLYTNFTIVKINTFLDLHNCYSTIVIFTVNELNKNG